MITIKAVTHCPACGVECRVEPQVGGTDTHYYVPVMQDRIAELEQELLEERASYEAERQRLRGEFELTWYALKNNQVSIGDRIDNALKIIKQALEIEI